MKLFDLNRQERNTLRELVIWHLGYLAFIAAFFWVIYYFDLFRSHRFLKEKPIFLALAPVCTLAFVIISPWRKNWLMALKDTRERLEGEPAFYLMGALVFLMGFYLYSVLLWGLGALGPFLFYIGRTGN